MCTLIRKARQNVILVNLMLSGKKRRRDTTTNTIDMAICIRIVAMTQELQRRDWRVLINVVHEQFHKERVIDIRFALSFHELMKVPTLIAIAQQNQGDLTIDCCAPGPCMRLRHTTYRWTRGLRIRQ